MKKWIAIAVAAAALTPFAPVKADAATAKTIADVLTADGDKFDRNSGDFDIVTEAVLLFPDLVAAASDPSANLTVFAPSDRAFRWLAYELTGKWIRAEKDVFAAVASLGADTVKNVLLYHIIGSKISGAQAVKSNNAKIPTLLGPSLTVKVNHVGWIRLVDADRTDRNPGVNKVNVGGKLANGYIHALDAVLRPVDLP